jgi:hypothetical protein
VSARSPVRRWPGLLLIPGLLAGAASAARGAEAPGHVTAPVVIDSGDPHGMASLYTALHRNIQDVFNEYGVRIMTPAYVADPAIAKVVPKAQWYDPPARAPEAPPLRPAG